MSTSASAIPFPAPSEALRRGRAKQTDGPYPPAEVAKRAEAMNEITRTPDSPSDNRHSLQQIKGIGQAIAQALNRLDIHSHADLTGFTSDSLADLLKAEIPLISPKRIERDDWLGQARALARRQKDSGSSQPQTDEPSAPSAERDQKATAKAPHESWRELADFFVSFGFAINEQGEKRLQTKAHYSQADKPKAWDGIVTDELIDWMLNQASLSQPAETAAQTEIVTPPAPVTLYNAQVEISEVRVSEIPTPQRIGEKKLIARVRFQISGPEAEALTANRLPFRIEVHTVDLKSRASCLVASGQGQLQPQVFEYSGQQAFPMPEPGRYELHSILLLLPPGDMMACYRGPIFNVVP
jgi:predicted flap endonuclease-1-like 5' DNA nuclease